MVSAAGQKEATGQKHIIVVYMQMGGNAGDPSTLARTNGARAAAAANNVNLVEQYSGWIPRR